jgi:LCP family protein required for cell wall assembly
MKQSPNIDGIFMPRQNPNQKPLPRGAAIPRRPSSSPQSIPQLKLPSPQMHNTMPTTTPKEALNGMDITLDDPVDSKKMKGGRRGHKNRSDRHGLKRIFHKPSRRQVICSLVVLFVLLAGVGGYFGYVVYHNLHKILQGGGHSAILSNSLDLAALQHEGDGRINILVGGYSAGDTAHEDAVGGGGEYLTDSMMLVSIDPVNKTASLVSIPRDLWVQLPGCTAGFTEQKINAAYECGAGLNNQNPKAGLTYMSNIVKNVFGVNINYAAVVDYTAFEDLVNAVGGITVNIQGTDPRGILDRNFDWVCDYKCFEVKYPNGPATLNGTQAMYLARARGDAVAPEYEGYGFANGDFERQQNQRDMLIAIEGKAEQISFLANPVKVTQFLNGLGSNVITNLDQNDALALAKIVKDIPSSKITSVGIPNTLEGDSNPILTSGYAEDGTVSVEEPVAGLDNYTALQNFIHSKLVDPYIIKEHPTIAIYNGTTTAGAAAAEEAILQSYGYDVVSIGTAATQNYQTTVFYDTTDGKLPVTKQYLQNRLGVKATSGPAPTGLTAISTSTTTTGTATPTPSPTPTPSAQYVIILGEDNVSQLVPSSSTSSSAIDTNSGASSNYSD